MVASELEEIKKIKNSDNSSDYQSTSESESLKNKGLTSNS